MRSTGTNAARVVGTRAVMVGHAPTGRARWHGAVLALLFSSCAALPPMPPPPPSHPASPGAEEAPPPLPSATLAPKPVARIQLVEKAPAAKRSPAKRGEQAKLF